MARTEPGPPHESTGELIRRSVQNAQGLLDKQITLAKLELREDVRQVAQAGKLLGAGLALLMVAGICFLIFIFLGIDSLARGWGWLAALIVAIAFAIVGAVLAKFGSDRVKVQPLSRTRETLKEDAVWAKHPLTFNGRSSTSETTSRPPSPN